MNQQMAQLQYQNMLMQQVCRRMYTHTVPHWTKSIVNWNELPITGAEHCTIERNGRAASLAHGNNPLKFNLF